MARVVTLSLPLTARPQTAIYLCLSSAHCKQTCFLRLLGDCEPANSDNGTCCVPCIMSQSLKLLCLILWHSATRCLETSSSLSIHGDNFATLKAWRGMPPVVSLHKHHRTALKHQMQWSSGAKEVTAMLRAMVCRGAYKLCVHALLLLIMLFGAAMIKSAASAAPPEGF